ncbi:hypothetical protein [Altererythrobacter sp. GH1-8]|uniref:hypothetical protein n=1 Tax=Altererythrobacter sp. GH1-8 TaxID=3349333 RepID=UPI00374D5349
MFKKFLLLSILVVGGLWLAGYDMERISNMISGAGQSSAGKMSGRDVLEDNRWPG